uniref:Uncharacterized protein n=1 Tax=uncultured bacterium W5-102b TaxID=1130996 RepID=H9BWI9_9BACT|nr:hypothetical protein [uncultured bacterium W5-102b]
MSYGMHCNKQAAGRDNTVNDDMGLLGSADWLTHPRLVDATALLRQSPTGKQLVEDLSKLPVRLEFHKPPATMLEFLDGTMGAYQPSTNRMRMAWESGITDVHTIGDTQFKPWSTTDVAALLAHEGQHQIQNRHFRSIPRYLLLDGPASIVAGAREALSSRNAGESLATAYKRGQDRRYIRHEIEAFRVADRIMYELGETPLHHAADGTYLGDDAILTGHAKSYRPSTGRVLAQTGIVVAFGAAAALEGTSRLRS